MKKILLLFSLSLFCCKSTEFKSSQLQGDWALSKADNVSFSITNDSIFYPEYEGKFNIVLLKNKLQVFEEGNPVNYFEVVEVTRDSLFLKLQNGEVQKYCKITE